MAYNTGNPVGSNDPRDFFDDVVVLDNLELGSDPSYPDRLGRPRKSRSGMEAEFDASQAAHEQEFQDDQESRADRFNLFIAASGYQDIGNYAAGLVISEYNQILRKDGEFYRLSPDVEVPYTLTGNWAAESSKFVAVGDAALRQELATTGGSGHVEYSGRTVQARLSEIPSAMDAPYSAAGNGVANDTAAFNALEAVFQGRMIDLGGRKFVVDQVPTKNGYYNGSFKVGGFTKPAVLSSTFATQPPHFHKFGGQLAALFLGLSNPLEQITSVVFLGDSQTWGSGNTGEQATTEPRDGTLSDARDYFSTSSWVNIVKRYIGSKFARGAAPVLSNHPTSPSGESIATYTTQHVLFPNRGDFTLTQSAGLNISNSEVAAPSAVSYFQLQLQNGNTSVESSHTVSFTFTGTTFKLGFGCTDGTATFYELVVDGVSQGVFSTHAGQDGFIDVSNNNYRTHTFGYVRNKIVEIKTRRNGESGNRILRLESITIDKVIRLTNNGLNGQSSISYRANNLVGSPADGLAVLPQDNHVIVKIGTNDRISSTSRPKGSNLFKYNLGQFIDAIVAISPTANIILACSNPATEDPATYSFTMQEVRNVTYQVAKARSIDMVDGYSVFSSVTLQPGFSDDGLHLNQLGYTLEARNFINSLEAA